MSPDLAWPETASVSGKINTPGDGSVLKTEPATPALISPSPAQGKLRARRPEASLRTSEDDHEVRALPRREQHLGVLYATPTDSTFTEHVEPWLEARAREICPRTKRLPKPRTLRMYRHYFARHWIPVFGPQPITSIRLEHVVSACARLTQSVRAMRTARNPILTLRAFLRDRIGLEVPWSVVPPSIDGPDWHPSLEVFDALELARLLASAAPTEDLIVYGLMGLAGLRNGEANELRWSDLDRTMRPLWALSISRSVNCDLEVTATKTYASRTVPVHPVLATHLDRHSRAWPDRFGRPHTEDDLVAPRLAQGELVHHDPTRAGERWRAVLEELGMRHRQSYDLRSTFISLAIEGGAAAPLVERLCQASPGAESGGRVLARYSRFSWKARCEAVSAIRINLPVSYEGQLTLPFGK